MGRTAERRRHLRKRKEHHRWRIQNETANTLTHLAGLVLSILGSVAVLIIAIRAQDPLRIVSASIYGVTLLAMYTVSTLYHLSKNPRQKLKLRLWDHCAIYLFIAGSYTPFALVSLRGGWGWSLFGVVWASAIAGVSMKLFVSGKASGLSTALYLALGWVSVVAIVPLWHALDPAGFTLVVAGGLAYTAGTLFFAFDHRRYFHATWHLFVLAGTVLHFFAIAVYVLPGRP